MWRMHRRFVLFSAICVLIAATACHSLSPTDGRERLYREELLRKDRGDDRVKRIVASSEPFIGVIAASGDSEIQADGLAAIWKVDREDSLPLFRETVEDDRFPDSVRYQCVYSVLESRIRHLNEANPAERRESELYVDFLHWASERETGPRSRYGLDRAMERLDPSWHGSERRRRFLERSLLLADSEERKELVRRWLRENEEPLPEPSPPPATPSRDIIVF